MSSNIANIKAIIMAGGAGRRLWPLSRTYSPKQFLEIDNTSLLSSAVTQAIHLIPQVVENLNATEINFQASYDPETFLEVQTAPNLFKNVKKHLKPHEKFNSFQVTSEPSLHNTAFAYIWAAVKTYNDDPNSLLIISPADHFIDSNDVDLYKDALTSAAIAAHAGRLAIIGIEPNYASIEYNYVLAGHGLEIANDTFDVDLFEDTDSNNRAYELVNEGALWNSNILVAKPESIIEACRELGGIAEEILNAAEAALQNDNYNTSTIPNANFNQLVLEHSSLTAVVPANIMWNGIASFKELELQVEETSDGNRFDAPVVEIVTSNTTVFSTDDKLIALAGLEDALVVDTPDALFIAEKGALSQIYRLTDKVAEIKPEILRQASKQVYSWGSWKTIDQSDTFWVRRFEIHPNSQFDFVNEAGSQKNWTVVFGKAQIAIDNKTLEASSGDTFSTALAKPYSIKNLNETEPLVLIEVVTNKS